MGSEKQNPSPISHSERAGAAGEARAQYALYAHTHARMLTHLHTPLQCQQAAKFGTHEAFNQSSLPPLHTNVRQMYSPTPTSPSPIYIYVTFMARSCGYLNKAAPLPKRAHNGRTQRATERRAPQHALPRRLSISKSNGWRPMRSRNALRGGRGERGPREMRHERMWQERGGRSRSDRGAAGCHARSHCTTQHAHVLTHPHCNAINTHQQTVRNSTKTHFTGPGESEMMAEAPSLTSSRSSSWKWRTD